MKIAKFLVILLLSLSLVNTVEAKWWDSISGYFKRPEPMLPPMIRVLIVNDQPGVVLEVKGKYKIFDPYTKEHISTRFTGKRKFIQATEDGIKWGEEFPGLHQLLIVPDDLSITTTVDGIEYRGSIYIFDVGGTISVVNQIYIEDYLDSILSLQYRNPLPDEALAAIAIAARTNAYFQAKHPKNQFWDVDGQQAGYQGYAVTHQPSGIDKAIYDTRYMIMSLGNSEDGNKPFPAYWNSNSDSKATKEPAIYSRISLLKVEEMAQKGEHAAQILAKAFPNASIRLTQSLQAYRSKAKN